MSRKPPEAEKPENHERWIVSYADMVTLLFAVFVVLYAIGDTNPEKLEEVRASIEKAFEVGVLTAADGASPVFEGGGGLAPSFDEIQARQLVEISDSLSLYANQEGLDGRIQVRSDASTITISLADNLLFDPGSADLKPGSQEVILEVAGLLQSIPNDIRIEGHTDNIPVNNPDFATNWELSSARATTVLRFLVESGGLPQSRLSTAAFADTEPVADNATPEGRALNRRADIVVVYPTAAEIASRLAPDLNEE
jgi:chemotaxis protein MotB